MEEELDGAALVVSLEASASRSAQWLAFCRRHLQEPGSVDLTNDCMGSEAKLDMTWCDSLIAS